MKFLTGWKRLKVVHLWLVAIFWSSQFLVLSELLETLFLEMVE